MSSTPVVPVQDVQVEGVPVATPVCADLVSVGADQVNPGEPGLHAPVANQESASVATDQVNPVGSSVPAPAANQDPVTGQEGSAPPLPVGAVPVVPGDGISPPSSPDSVAADLVAAPTPDPEQNAEDGNV